MDVLMRCLILGNLLHLVKTYENIALNKPAWQKYPYLKKPWGADLAVDGRFSNLSQEGGQCAISQNEPTAEWRVDLQGILSIHHISLQYMTEQKPWGAENKLSSVLLGFSVYISNTTRREEGILCFKDTIYTVATVPNPVLLICPHHGQYVFFYNDRINPPYPADYSNHSANDLCEVQVFGCPNVGVYGEDCSIACPRNCQDNRCSIVDGTCLGCVVGYRGQQCQEECTDNTYGPQCSGACGKCRNNDQCNNVNGRCPNGCQRGKQGVKCDKDCDDGQFGENCSFTCGHCLGNTQCDSTHGTCLHGCDSGYFGHQCTQTSNTTAVPMVTMDTNNTAVPMVTMDNPLFVPFVVIIAVFLASVAISLVTCIRIRKIRRSKAICHPRRLVAETVENNSYASASIGSEYVEMGDVQKNCDYEDLQ